ncbi:MAG: YlbF family regulator [Lachnospiraceae bacterium]|nr:YlbF family regulator [Lachnospiraceae bacterium]
MSDREIIEAARAFADQIMTSDTYKEYLYQREKIKKQPELYEKVNEFRQRNFDLQNDTDDGDMLDRMEAFEREYEQFREDPLVDDFLRAELAFCRMMQEVYVLLADEIDFEV